MEKTAIIRTPQSELHHWLPGPQPVVTLPLFMHITGEPAREYDILSGLGWEVEIVRYSSGEGDVHYLPGRIEILNLTLARPAHNMDTTIWDWRSTVIYGTPELKTIRIPMRNRHGATVFSLIQAQTWPAALYTTYNRAQNRTDETISLPGNLLEFEN